MSFPDYGTSIGEEIARALAGEREYRPDVMQLLHRESLRARSADLQRLDRAAGSSSSAIGTPRRASRTAKRRASIPRG